MKEVSLPEKKHPIYKILLDLLCIKLKNFVQGENTARSSSNTVVKMIFYPKKLQEFQLHLNLL